VQLCGTIASDGIPIFPFFSPKGGIEALGKIGDVFGQNMYITLEILDFITTTPYTEQATGAVTKLLQETEKHLNCPLSFGWPVRAIRPYIHPGRGGGIYAAPTKHSRTREKKLQTGCIPFKTLCKRISTRSTAHPFYPNISTCLVKERRKRRVPTQTWKGERDKISQMK
jgi:hypothetical protein